MGEYSEDDQLHIPQVADERKPKIGMSFTSIDDAFLFYNQYAREAGFSARMSKNKKDKLTNEDVWKQFVCSKEGHTDENRRNKQWKGDESRKERERGMVRTGCRARISIAKTQYGPSWVVSALTESHNHPLSTPSKVHLLRSHRNVSAAKKALTQQFAEANVPTCQQIRLLEIEYGGPENIGCTEKDIRNFEMGLKDDEKGTDAETLIEFFESEKEKNSAFFFEYETDSEKKMSRCFWADPISRMAYNVFGDVVVFDTTYNTNKYGMIFAPFVGVNHHHQTIIFGCGFLSDEKTESFIWLFQSFLKSMPNGAPNIIITDQDPAMSKAIAQVFPGIVHRYCLWHILNKFSDKLGPVTFRDHYRTIKNVIVNSTTPDEFEESWKDVIISANMERNEWLSMMYELRAKWVPTYFTHIFSAGMSSSQRSESAHSFLKKYVSKRNSLMGFIIRFQRALRSQRHKELVADHVDVNEQPKNKTQLPMGHQMAKIYTRKKWIEFENEISESQSYSVQEISDEVELARYNVFHFQSSSKPRVVTRDKQKDYISCSCMKFDFDGIPCRHMLAYFRLAQVFQLPEQYIMKRWTQDAKVGAKYVIGEENISSNDNEKFLLTRHSTLSFETLLAVDEAALTDEGTKFMREQVQFIYRKLREMNSGKGLSTVNQKKKKFVDRDHVIMDPSGVRSKGCGKRLKQSKEKSTSKSRLCNGCGLRGVSHDKRNCPKLQDGSTTENHDSDMSMNEEDSDL